MIPRFGKLKCKCGIDYVKYNARGPAPVRCDFCLQRIKSRQNAIRVARHYRKVRMITNSQALIINDIADREEKDVLEHLKQWVASSNPKTGQKRYKVWITVEEVKDAPTL